MDRATKEPLWSRCETYSQLSIVAQLLIIKVYFNPPTKFFNCIIYLVIYSNPKDTSFAKDFYTTKKLVARLFY